MTWKPTWQTLGILGIIIACCLLLFKALSPFIKVRDKQASKRQSFKGAAQSLGSEKKSTDWECDKCKTVNEKSRTTCSGCSKLSPVITASTAKRLKPKKKIKQPRWFCAKCGAANTEFGTHCHDCGLTYEDHLKLLKKRKEQSGVVVIDVSLDELKKKKDEPKPEETDISKEITKEPDKQDENVPEPEPEDVETSKQPAPTPIIQQQPEPEPEPIQQQSKPPEPEPEPIQQQSKPPEPEPKPEPQPEPITENKPDETSAKPEPIEKITTATESHTSTEEEEYGGLNVDPITVQPGQWICPLCKAPNENNASQCAKCNRVAWNCPKCTFTNDIKKNTCEMCGASPDYEPLPKWNCSLCTLLNDGDATTCRVCNNPKTQSATSFAESPLPDIPIIKPPTPKPEPKPTCKKCGRQLVQGNCAECDFEKLQKEEISKAQALGADDVKEDEKGQKIPETQEDTKKDDKEAKQREAYRAALASKPKTILLDEERGKSIIKDDKKHKPFRTKLASLLKTATSQKQNNDAVDDIQNERKYPDFIADCWINDANLTKYPSNVYRWLGNSDAKSYIDGLIKWFKFIIYRELYQFGSPKDITQYMRKHTTKEEYEIATKVIVTDKQNSFEKQILDATKEYDLTVDEINKITDETLLENIDTLINQKAVVIALNFSISKLPFMEIRGLQQKIKDLELATDKKLNLSDGILFEVEHPDLHDIIVKERKKIQTKLEEIDTVNENPDNAIEWVIEYMKSKILLIYAESRKLPANEIKTKVGALMYNKKIPERLKLNDPTKLSDEAKTKLKERLQNIKYERINPDMVKTQIASQLDTHTKEIADLLAVIYAYQLFTLTEDDRKLVEDILASVKKQEQRIFLHLPMFTQSKLKVKK